MPAIAELPKPILCTAGAPELFRNDSNIVLDQRKIDELNQMIASGKVGEVDGYRDKFTNNDGQATRVFDVAWDATDEFKNYILGYSLLEEADDESTSDGGAVFFIHRVLPDQHPEWPWLYCQEIEMIATEGAWVPDRRLVLEDVDGNGLIGIDGQLDTAPFVAYANNAIGAGYGFVRYACHYRPLPGYYALSDWDVYHPDSPLSGNGMKELNRWVSRGRSFAAKNLPLPRGQVQFVEGPPGIINEPIPELGDVRILPIIERTYTWHDVPSLPEDAIHSIVGTVNAATFDGLAGFPAFPPETLLCQTPSQPEQRRGPTGRTIFTITYRLLHNRFGWNKFIAPDGNFYRASIVIKQSAVGANQHLLPVMVIPVYRSTDFSLLFTAPSRVVN